MDHASFYASGFFKTASTFCVPLPVREIIANFVRGLIFSFTGFGLTDHPSSVEANLDVS